MASWDRKIGMGRMGWGRGQEGMGEGAGKRAVMDGGGDCALSAN